MERGEGEGGGNINAGTAIGAHQVVLRIKRKRSECPLESLLVSSTLGTGVQPSPMDISMTPQISSSKKKARILDEGLAGALANLGTEEGLVQDVGMEGAAVNDGVGYGKDASSTTVTTAHQLLFSRLKKTGTEMDTAAISATSTTMTAGPGVPGALPHIAEVGRRRARFRAPDKGSQPTTTATIPPSSLSASATVDLSAAAPPPAVPGQQQLQQQQQQGDEAELPTVPSVHHLEIIDLVVKKPKMTPPATSAAAALPSFAMHAAALTGALPPPASSGQPMEMVASPAPPRPPSTSMNILNPIERAMDEAIVIAFQTGDCNAIFDALSAGAPPDYQRRQSDMTTALMAAAYAGHMEAVNHLLMRGANPLLVDVNGNDAGDLAMRNGHYDVLTMLQRAVVARERRTGGGRSASKAKRGMGVSGTTTTGRADMDEGGGDDDDDEALEEVMEEAGRRGGGGGGGGGEQDDEYVYDLYAYTPMPPPPPPPPEGMPPGAHYAFTGGAAGEPGEALFETHSPGPHPDMKLGGLPTVSLWGIDPADGAPADPEELLNLKLEDEIWGLDAVGGIKYGGMVDSDVDDEGGDDDSNAEDYYANDYPDDEEDEDVRRLQGWGKRYNNNDNEDYDYDLENDVIDDDSDDDDDPVRMKLSRGGDAARQLRQDWLTGGQPLPGDEAHDDDDEDEYGGYLGEAGGFGGAGGGGGGGGGSSKRFGKDGLRGGEISGDAVLGLPAGSYGYGTGGGGGSGGGGGADVIGLNRGDKINEVLVGGFRGHVSRVGPNADDADDDV